jgi:hypothetical protein
MENQMKKKDLKKAIDSFLGEQPTPQQSDEEMDCSSGVCVIKNDKSVLERINKKIITEDGRQLLI